MNRWLRAVTLVAFTSVAAAAQPEPAYWGSRSLEPDGRLTFVRLRWRGGTFGVVPREQGINFWLHEYPQAEQNLMSVIDFYTTIDARTDGSLNLTLDDPQLFRHPIAMMWEPGFWIMTDREATRLREYLLKGGFVIFNDFELDQWDNFEAQMERVISGSRWIPLGADHPIFNQFFSVPSLHAPHPPQHHLYGMRPMYFGLFEDNDPAKRMMAIASYNQNLAEYWQMAGTGLFPVAPSNDAFKVGINFMIYALTH
jgi:Domain of unknown function (DUF4159)